MNEESEIIKQILQKYPSILSAEFSKEKYVILNDYLLFVCNLNLYDTNNCFIVRDERDNVSIFTFFEEGSLSVMNNEMSEHRNISFDVSSKSFQLQGSGFAVAVFQLSNLTHKISFYFPNINNVYSNTITLEKGEEKVLIKDRQNRKSYIINVNEITKDFYLTIDSVCYLYGDYIIAFPDDYYDLESSFSLIELSTKIEYVLAKELEKRDIKFIECSKCYFDTKQRLLYFSDFDSGEKYCITLDYI